MYGVLLHLICLWHANGWYENEWVMLHMNESSHFYMAHLRINRSIQGSFIFAFLSQEKQLYLLFCHYVCFSVTIFAFLSLYLLFCHKKSYICFSIFALSVFFVTCECLIWEWMRQVTHEGYISLLHGSFADKQVYTGFFYICFSCDADLVLWL